MKTYNFAVDESTTKSVLKGIKPASQYVKARKNIFRGSYPYRIAQDGKVYPLEELDKLLLPRNKHHTYVVLSITGNDVRRFLKSFDSVETMMGNLNSETWHWQKNYERIIQELIKRGVKVIPVVCYRPHLSMKGMYPRITPKMFNELVTELSKTMSAVARKHNLPVIDLSRTFDPTDATDYGKPYSEHIPSTPIEPSVKSCGYIAKLVDHVVKQHDWRSASKFYYLKKSDIHTPVEEENRRGYEITFK